MGSKSEEIVEKSQILKGKEEEWMSSRPSITRERILNISNQGSNQNHQNYALLKNLALEASLVLVPNSIINFQHVLFMHNQQEQLSPTNLPSLLLYNKQTKSINQDKILSRATTTDPLT